MPHIYCLYDSPVLKSYGGLSSLASRPEFLMLFRQFMSAPMAPSGTGNDGQGQATVPDTGGPTIKPHPERIARK